MRFFKGWASKPRSVGSLTPTGRATAQAMASFVPLDSHLPVLELGPGTGAITRAMIDRGVAPDRIVAIEYNGDFHRHLVRRFPDVRFIHGDAFALDGALSEIADTKFSTVICGLPLLNFPRSLRRQLIVDGLGRLEDHGAFVQLCYGPRPPVDAMPGQYTMTRTDWIIKNVPPARLFIYRKQLPIN